MGTREASIVIRLIILLTTLGVATGAAQAQADFSADIVNLRHSDNPFQTKIYSTRGKLRFEGRDQQGRSGSIMIVNLATRRSIVLLPQQRMYLEQARPQIPYQGVAFFQARDVDNACPEWQKVAGKDLEHCEKIGTETVDGRAAVKYDGKTVTGERSETTSIWLDTRLHFPVKWQGPVGAGELRNIQEGAQPANLFSIPAGYSRRHYAQTQTKP